MKNLVKVFSLVCLGSVLFSCSTDEQDTDLERAIEISQNIQQAQMREGDENSNNTVTSEMKEDGNPLIILIKRD